MLAPKKHILINGFVENKNFQSKVRGRTKIPAQNRQIHGEHLLRRYDELINESKNRSVLEENPITGDIGIYVKIVSFPGVTLPLNHLDTKKSFKLCSCSKENECETAVIFIPESKRGMFKEKLNEYLNPQEDRTPKNQTKENVAKLPKNRTLIDSIADIKLANLQSFWTDNQNDFPTDPEQNIWWELWLKKRNSDENHFEIAEQLAKRIGARLGNTSQSFFGVFVVLIKATVNQLEQALELIDCLEELRRAKETPNIIINSSLQDQKQWTEDLLQRVKIDDTSSIAVIILDTGINYYHPLHALVCNENQADCWHPDWPHFDRSDSSNLSKPEDHGSRQAGLAVFGDLCDVMSSSEPILIKHSIESGRILPPSGQNQDPELYGHITVDTAAKLEIKHPNRNRVYSLAVTADSAYMGGQPSSWSAEIDQFSSGIQDKKQRLFIISTGNNRDLSPNVSLWNQLHLAEIEDPAQSWNALTIGAYTEKTTNDNPAFNGWAPFARVGDVAPASRSSVNWEWRKHAPYKPDLVAEGGNRLLSPDGKELSTEDVVSLLTTSGRTTGQLFEVSRDTSAACALVSRQAAIIMTEYPKYWPETVRGLLVHSAKWTRAMRQQFKLLSDKPTNMAKENMLRSVGYGVPNLERALYSANNVLTLIAQNHLKPFKSGKSDAIMNEMQLYKLPWPSEVLHQLPPNTEVKLRVTLSYFIEPNPGCRGYRDRFRYQSHGLRFAVIRPDQKLENFLASINKLAVTEEYKSLEGTATGWFLGPKLRTRGCLHADMWSGSAAALANMHTIAIFPVGGWWKYHSAKERWKNSVRYSLIVSIEAPDETIDIYSVVENMIETKINIEV